MLHSPKAFFLESGYELAVFHKCCCDVTVEGVNAEHVRVCCHREVLPISLLAVLCAVQCAVRRASAGSLRRNIDILGKSVVWLRAKTMTQEACPEW